MPENQKNVLIEQAVAALRNAYAPYSRFRVGACIAFSNGSNSTGANIENASYGLTVCAERVALFKGVSEGARKIGAVAIASENNQFPYPCGACRQVLAEFGADFPIYLVNGLGQCQSFNLSQLFPHRFELLPDERANG